MSNPDANSVKLGRLNRADILASALQLLDEVGLPDLSMRRLAAKLDMQPSGLYWHFENKQTLFARLSDHIVDHILPEEDSSLTWQEQSLIAACALRDSLLAYRDGAEIVSSTLALGLGAEAAFDRIRRPLLQSGFADDLVRVATESIVFLVLGQVWHQQQRMAADSLGVVAGLAETTSSSIASANNQDALAAGIALILSGLGQESLHPQPKAERKIN
jgi:AcrR family transcriptional regulator